MVRLRAFVLERMPQSVAHAGGFVTSLVLFFRQVADKFTNINPAMQLQNTTLPQELIVHLSTQAPHVALMQGSLSSKAKWL